MSDLAELHIVGTGRLSPLVSKLKIDGLIYHGSLFDKELQEMYRSCDVFVFPTEWDAQPTVVVEAVSSGLFTICSDYLKGVFDDFLDSGFLEYVKLSTESLIESIRVAAARKYDDFDLREKMHNLVEIKRSQQSEVKEILEFMEYIGKK